MTAKSHASGVKDWPCGIRAPPGVPLAVSWPDRAMPQANEKPRMSIKKKKKRFHHHKPRRNRQKHMVGNGVGGVATSSPLAAHSGKRESVGGWVGEERRGRERKVKGGREGEGGG